MHRVMTLREMAGVIAGETRFSESAVVTIDAQEEYRSGRLPLHKITEAIQEGAAVLDKARMHHTPIFHVVQTNPPQAKMFAQGSVLSQVFHEYAISKDEVIVPKTLPNSFTKTTLYESLIRTGRRNLIVFGFMTHMCVSTTIRAALDHGFSVTVVADACATRDLPSIDGTIISAQDVHRVALAELADRFAWVVKDQTCCFS